MENVKYRIVVLIESIEIESDGKLEFNREGWNEIAYRETEEEAFELMNNITNDFIDKESIEKYKDL